MYIVITTIIVTNIVISTTLPTGLQTLPSGKVPSLRSFCSKLSQSFSRSWKDFNMVMLLANWRTFLVKHSSVMPVRPSSGSLHSLPV